MTEPSLSDLIFLSRQAGEILFSGFGKQHQIDRKGVIDLVTEIDHQSEQFLIHEINRRFPTHQIVAEESGTHHGENCCLWYIDPLDGTVNYAHGLPIFSVSLAFQIDGEINLAVVYDPLRDEMFSAVRGQGAYLNDKPLAVSQTSELNRSLLVTGFPYDIRENPSNNLDLFAKFSMVSQGVRRLGSAALDLCYTAAGRFDGYWEIRLSPWDVAAGGLIAREAGGVVTDLNGNSDFLTQSQSILAANPVLYQQMLVILNETR